MKIQGLHGIKGEQLNIELQRGGKFVIYQYCLSMLVLTFKRPSDVYFIKAGTSRINKGLKFSLVSFLCGWWGIPWGPIYTIQSLATNFSGGKDVTKEVVASLSQSS